MQYLLLSLLALSVAGCFGTPLSSSPAAPASPRPLRVVCFGDSITGPAPRQFYIDKYLKWSDLLGLMLEAKLGTKGEGVEVLNRGLAGDSTYPRLADSPAFGAVQRLQRDLLSENPDIAIILIAGNDKPDHAAETRANLTEIITRAQAAHPPGIKVLLLQYAVLPPAHPGKDGTWYHLADNNPLIAEIAAAHHVPTLALQPIFDQALAAGLPRTALVNEADGVHLNPAGEMTLARAVFTKLVDLGWIK